MMLTLNENIVLTYKKIFLVILHPIYLATFNKATNYFIRVNTIFIACDAPWSKNKSIDLSFDYKIVVFIIYIRYNLTIETRSHNQLSDFKTYALP